jgi:hypothetical protein
MRMRIATFFAAGLSALVLGVGGVSASSAPVTWSFDVSFDPAATAANGAPTWTGTASGPGWGTIAVKLLGADLRGEALHIELEVTLAAGAQSSTVQLSGLFNEVTTRGVLNGIVSKGWFAGAQAHQEAARFDPTSSARLTGTLRLMTGSADA